MTFAARAAAVLLWVSGAGLGICCLIAIQSVAATGRIAFVAGAGAASAADDLVHAFRSLLRPGGVLVLEEPDAASWRFNPEATVAHRLIGLIQEAFAAGGGDFNVGRHLRELLGGNVAIRADVLALPPGHPYLRLPLQFATSLEPTLLTLVGREELDRLRDAVASELEQPNLWGTTFTLIQAWREMP